MTRRGTAFGVGVGPGDPELMTVKAVKALERADVVAFFAKRGGLGNAHKIAQHVIRPDAERLPLIYPYTTEIAHDHPTYVAALQAFYDESARHIAERLEQGRDVCVLCEGDPLLYGSYIHLHDRLARTQRCVVIPGITSFAGCAAGAGIPLVSTDRNFSIIPGTLGEAELETKLERADGAAIIKLGRNYPKVRRVLAKLGRLSKAMYFEHGTTEREVAMPLADKTDEKAAYFSLILVPGHERDRAGKRAEQRGGELP